MESYKNKKDEEVFLELDNISEDLLIKEIWLFPINKFFAFNKIKRESIQQLD